MRPGISTAALFILALFTVTSCAAPPIEPGPATRKPGEDVGSAEFRQRQGQFPGEGLLSSGWGLTPAGQKHVPTSDMPLKMLIAPDQKRLVAVTCGYNKQGL